MRRVTLILCTFVVLVTAAGVVAYHVGGKTARATGRQLYAHRPGTVGRVRDVASEPARVVWLGDSTLQGIPAYPSYADMVQEQVLNGMLATSLIVAAPGMDFYGYWSVAGRIAALHPKLVIVIANLRTFIPEGGIRGLTDMTGEIDLADLPRTLALPYYVRGMTAPRLLLARVLRTELGEDVFLTFEGIRRNAQEARAWSVLGPAQRPPALGEPFFRFGAEMDRILAAYDRPIGWDNALVQFAAPTVSRFTRDGVAVLVVVTAMPWERALEAGYYAEERVVARVAMLRDVVELNGGHLVDLHRALTKDHFRDIDCHFTVAGAAEMARLVGPTVRRLLLAPDAS